MIRYQLLNGTNVRFNCSFLPSPTGNNFHILSTDRKFNGKEIKHDGKHYKISSEDATFTLLISEVDREDAGLYSCEISNQWGSNECDGHLYVKCLPRFDKELEDMKVKEGDMDVEFTLKLNAFPKATVKWWVQLTFMICLIFFVLHVSKLNVI